jgi:hypothetical protein
MIFLSQAGTRPTQKMDQPDLPQQTPYKLTNSTPLAGSRTAIWGRTYHMWPSPAIAIALLFDCCFEGCHTKGPLLRTWVGTDLVKEVVLDKVLINIGNINDE